jgi:ADP-heptose:LPS heptosyltransferase
MSGKPVVIDCQPVGNCYRNHHDAAEGQNKAGLRVELTADRRLYAILTQCFFHHRPPEAQRKKKGPKKKERGGPWNLTQA